MKRTVAVLIEPDSVESAPRKRFTRSDSSKDAADLLLCLSRERDPLPQAPMASRHRRRSLSTDRRDIEQALALPDLHAIPVSEDECEDCHSARQQGLRQFDQDTLYRRCYRSESYLRTTYNHERESAASLIAKALAPPPRLPKVGPGSVFGPLSFC